MANRILNVLTDGFVVDFKTGWLNAHSELERGPFDHQDMKAQPPPPLCDIIRYEDQYEGQMI